MKKRYVIVIETEDSEIGGVRLACEADPNGYMTQSAVDGGERSALASMFDALSLMVESSSEEQFQGDLERWSRSIDERTDGAS